jgi:hypothetical protein
MYLTLELRRFGSPPKTLNEKGRFQSHLRCLFSVVRLLKRTGGAVTRRDVHAITNGGRFGVNQADASPTGAFAERIQTKRPAQSSSIVDTLVLYLAFAKLSPYRHLTALR